MSQVLPKPKPLSDPHEIIIRGCREQDLPSQERLYRLCYPEMIKICLRYAGDMDGAGLIYNNAMLRVFKNIGSYHHEGKLTGWIKTIVIHCCLDHVKKAGRLKNIPLEQVQEEQVSIAEAVLSALSVKDLQRITSELPKATGAVFNLYIFEGFTHKQISEALGISEGTSKWHLNEARRRFKTKSEHFLNPGLKTNADRK